MQDVLTTHLTRNSKFLPALRESQDGVLELSRARFGLSPVYLSLTGENEVLRRL